MRKVIVCVAVLMLLSISAGGVNEVDTEGELKNTLDLQSVEDASDMPGSISIYEGVDVDEALTELYGELKRESPGILKDALKSAALIVLISYVCAAAQSLGESACDAAKLAGVAAVAIISLRSGGALLSKCLDTIWSMQDFTNVLLPVLSSAAAASGSFTAAAVRYTAASFFFNILINLTANVLTPMSCIFAAAAVGEAATGSKALAGVAGFIKLVTTLLLTALLLSFTVYISVTGIVAASADASAVKTAKTAISTLLPVAGSIASDAASAVMGAASVIKNGIGVFGLAAVSFICAVPFLSALIRFIVYKCAAAITAETSDGALAKLTGRLGDAYAIMASAIGAAAIMQFISIFTFMGATTI